MAFPKGFIKNIRLTKPKVGPARRQELLDDIANQGTFLPRGVDYEDMDKSFIEMVNDDLEIVIDGKKVPVIFLTIQRWAEFSKTWKHSDEYKNVKIPFITVVRRPDIQVGTNQAGNWNIPGNRGYTYMKVPSNESGRKGMDVYKIPQPTSVDITYDVRLFCNRMRDLNKLHEDVQQLFQSRQHYVYVNKHPMPIHLENITDESQTAEFAKRRFYVQLFEMKLLGYILDEEAFEVIPTVNRMRVSETLNTKNKRNVTDVTYKLEFTAGSTDSYTVTAEFNTNFTTMTNQTNISNIDVYVNNNLTTLPIDVLAGNTIRFDITRTNVSLDSSFVLSGVKT